MTDIYDVEMQVITPLIINTGETFDFGELIPVSSTDPKGAKRALKGIEADFPFREVYKGNINRISSIFEGMSSRKTRDMIDRIVILSSKDPLSTDDRNELVKYRNRVADIAAEKENSRYPVRMLEKARNRIYNNPLLQVNKIYSSALDSRTYIPGSSIKGAIRTGLLEYYRANPLRTSDKRPLEPDRDVPSWAKKGKSSSRNFEMLIMTGNPDFKPEIDPLRFFKVSDFAFEKLGAITYVGKIENDKDIPIFTAMTNSYAYSGVPVIARGTIVVDREFYKEFGVDQKTGLNGILKAASVFYDENLKDIEGEMTSDLMKYVYEKYQGLKKDDVYTLRFGRYVGIKDHTLNVRNPEFHYNPDINIKGGSILTVEGGVLPGICTIKVKEIK